MNVALYARVSSPRQQQTQTIEQQLERLRAQVADHGDWHLAEQHIYRDDGYSGAQLDAVEQPCSNTCAVADLWYPEELESIHTPKS